VYRLNWSVRTSLDIVFSVKRPTKWDVMLVTSLPVKEIVARTVAEPSYVVKALVELKLASIQILYSFLTPKTPVALDSFHKLILFCFHITSYGWILFLRLDSVYPFRSTTRTGL
jgi:hypothetical protein